MFSEGGKHQDADEAISSLDQGNLHSGGGKIVHHVSVYGSLPWKLSRLEQL